MAKAIRFHKQGGPEVLQLDEVNVAEPAPGQVRIRHAEFVQHEFTALESRGDPRQA